MKGPDLEGSCLADEGPHLEGSSLAHNVSCSGLKASQRGEHERVGREENEEPRTGVKRKPDDMNSHDERVDQSLKLNGADEDADIDEKSLI